MLKLEIKPYQLDFKFSAKTSRGSINERKVWFIRIMNSLGDYGIGEVAPIHRLSPEDPEEIEDLLTNLAIKISGCNAPVNQQESLDLAAGLVPVSYPSIRFGLETALLDLASGGKKTFFNQRLKDIRLPINGLIWMGDPDFMRTQIKLKLDQGFSCIKLKVGALDFDTEMQIIKDLRAISSDLIIRLDANGAFQTNEVLLKLKQLSRFNIHSIEQPILPRQPEAMEIVCLKSPIPIAFDEELIGIDKEQDRMELVQELKPQYLVLKPTLHGGMQSVKEWIDLAEIQGIEWWMTSYLESNIGLNAIAQFTSTFANSNHSGLGTGNLYQNNIESPIVIEKGFLQYDEGKKWDHIEF
jgi:o-succinylbenzoate synthase